MIFEFLGSIANELTGASGRPVLFQIAPPLVVLNRPPEVPTYTVAGSRGSISSAPATALPKPVPPALLQIAPWLALLKMPPAVPMKRLLVLLGSMAKTAFGKLLERLQLVPPFVLLNRPLPVAA